jgi:hypothetical protein
MVGLLISRGADLNARHPINGITPLHSAAFGGATSACCALWMEGADMSIKDNDGFPSDEALMKLFYLALRKISQKWTMPIRDWKAALTRFTIQFEERIPQM